jgi:hypothetical protein
MNLLTERLDAHRRFPPMDWSACSEMSIRFDQTPYLGPLDKWSKYPCYLLLFKLFEVCHNCQRDLPKA